MRSGYVIKMFLDRTSIRLVFIGRRLEPCKKQNKSIYLIYRTHQITKYRAIYRYKIINCIRINFDLNDSYIRNYQKIKENLLI